MQTSALVQFLADHNGVLECTKDGAGANIVTVTMRLSDGTDVKATGGDIDSLVSSLSGAHERYMKNRDVVPLTKSKQK